MPQARARIEEVARTSGRVVDNPRMGPELRESLEPGGAEERILSGVDFERLPRHVAVIMDGNGRWAAARRRPRVFGHRRGIESVRETVEGAGLLGLEALTLYAFSVENWKRPEREVRTLFTLLREYIGKEIDGLHEKGVRFRTIGRLADLPGEVRDDLCEATAKTAANEGLRFQIALSYGARTEILDAVEALRGGETVDRESLAGSLYTAGLPDPDLVIRTSGEQRTSNFLLYQAAHARFWVGDVFWPDFRRRHLYEAVADYCRS
jgi:undecaprenyl diphosphate synthase